MDYAAMYEVTPNEIASLLGVTGLTFRNWLRNEQAAGHPILATHEHGARYRFTRREADQLTAEFRAGRDGARTPSRSDTTATARAGGGDAAPSDPMSARRERPPAPERQLGSVARTGTSDAFAGLTMSREPGHRVTEMWMGEEVMTLADLVRPGLRAVVVGINPSPVSVAAGHYYQGQVGQRFLRRLVQAGVIDLAVGEFEDDRAYAAGLGFTDAVKRPTARAAGLRPGELAYGHRQLEQRLAAVAAPRVIFTFKKAAVALLGQFDGHGRLADRMLGGAEVFVMPGPMERTDRVDRALADLRAWWRA
jgi:TDG/mug DNA glycosylase family protein